MSKLKQSLRLQPEDDKLLRTLYKQFGVTSDNFPQFPEALQEFVQTWNNLTGRQDSPSDLLHYIFTKRKKGKWIKLGRSPKSQYTPSTNIACRFGEGDWKQLDEIYEEFQVASDNFALDDELGQKLADEFAQRTGKIVPTLVLCAVMIRRRKDGVLTTLRPKKDDGDLGFGDINEIAG